MTTMVKAPPGTTYDPMYPDSDGRDMGETDWHSIALVDLCHVIKDMFAARGVVDVHVAMQLVLYYLQGHPACRRDPDLMVTLGVGGHERRSFRTWEEGCFPNVSFEIASESTVNEDVGPKRTLYQSLSINEYFIFDPHQKFLDPPLRGFRLVNGVFQEITPGPNGALDSLELEARFEPLGSTLRVTDLTTGEVVLTRAERAEQAEESAEKANERAKEAQERADDLKAEVDRLRAELAKFQPPKP